MAGAALFVIGLLQAALTLLTLGYMFRPGTRLMVVAPTFLAELAVDMLASIGLIAAGVWFLSHKK